MGMQQGMDYYIDDGLFVMTEHFLLSQGYCCESDCRHCAYGFANDGQNKNARVITDELERRAEEEISSLCRDEDDKGLQVLLVADEVILLSKALAHFAEEYPDSLDVFKERLERPTSSRTTVMYSMLTRWMNRNSESSIDLGNILTLRSVELYGAMDLADSENGGAVSINVNLRP